MFAGAMNKKLSIEIVSDHVCPWCYVGKKRLESAIAQRPELDIEVIWQPFQLSPDMPREGVDRQEHYAEIFGEERAQQIMGSMKDTGTDEGIAFENKPGARSPNTLSAHALLLLARDDANVDQNELAEKLFHAHHVECADIGDHEVLVQIAGEVGLDVDAVRVELASGELETRVGELIGESAERGVSGVPFFIINDRYGISGAQPTKSLIEVFDQVSSEDETS
jgi:predicted DsbA family dithiol-disulfide isomerase